MDSGKRPAPEPPAQPPPDLPVPLQPPQQQQQPVHVIQNPAPVVQIQGDPDAAAEDSDDSQVLSYFVFNFNHNLQDTWK